MPVDRFPKVFNDKEKQRAYEEIRRRGESHSIAEMLAERQPPGTLNTERAFWSSRWDQMQHGGKVYLPQLASHPGDPKAYVSDTSDIRKVCQERNWSTDGVVKHKAVEMPPIPDVPIADDIVDKEIQTRIALDPSLADKDQRELREQVKEDITPDIKRD